jgi:hypothetical protein
LTSTDSKKLAVLPVGAECGPDTNQ